MRTFWKWLFWIGLPPLIAFNLVPYLMARNTADRVDVAVKELYHPDGRLFKKSVSGHLGKLARGHLNRILGRDDQRKAESYVVRLEITNYNENAITLLDGSYEFICDGDLLAEGRFQPKTPARFDPELTGDCYLPITFQRPSEDVYEILKKKSQAQIRGSVGFLVWDKYRMEMRFDTTLDLDSIVD